MIDLTVLTSLWAQLWTFLSTASTITTILLGILGYFIARALLAVFEKVEEIIMVDEPVRRRED